MIVKAEAQAKALEMIDTALDTQNGMKAAQFILGQRYITAYSKLGMKGNTLLLETEPTNVADQIQESLGLIDKIDDKIKSNS